MENVLTLIHLLKVILWKWLFALWWWGSEKRNGAVIWSIKRQAKYLVGSHHALSQNHHYQGQSMGPKQTEGTHLSPSFVPCANQSLSYMDKVGLKLARERVCIHALKFPTILCIPGVRDVVKRGKKISPHNRVGHAKFLHFDLCRFRKLAKAKEMQTERALNSSCPNTGQGATLFSWVLKTFLWGGFSSL